MIGLPSSVQIFLFSEPTDMRKGVYSLAALVTKYGHDPLGGHLYAFVSRRGDRIKILFWDNGGFVLWYKILERGRFRCPLRCAAETSVRLDPTQLAMLLDGIDLSAVKRPKKWAPPKKAA